MADKGIEEGKVCAILAYLLIGIIWYFVDDKMKKNQFVKFHVQQGLVSLVFGFCFFVAYGIVFTIITFPLRFIPLLGWMIIWVLSLLFWVPMIFDIIGIIYAFQGKEKQLPIIGKYGEKLKI
ncbi:hypothetical protein COV19_01900 [Candidatus Woesearchaeota archaeon CG10_big_fil_rev_8_21_14_0_10_44_13]|nr:MAG: hypothetical protein COV19_01900 [Candidatus Woesearchaeota archaeon CG10_big_fil_rev_8_21_14_0_10_44_13]